MIKIVGLPTLPRNSIYKISTQKAPFAEGDNDPEQVESIPDAWIVDETSTLGIAIEVKDKKNSIRLDQLHKHANRIKDYSHQYLLVITPDRECPDQIGKFEPKEGKKFKIIWHSWEEVYRWLKDLANMRSLKNRLEEFLISSIQEYLERRSEVLGFKGIKFPGGFDVADAKNILNAMMEELEPSVRRLYKDLGGRRPAITTFSNWGVWDCFGIRGIKFTEDLHFTFSINEDRLDICLTIPNAAGKSWSRLKSVFSDSVDEEKFFSILSKLRKEVPNLYFNFHQRHFIARRFGVNDGSLEFSVDTLGTPFRRSTSKVKQLPIWRKAIKDAILNKKGINAEVQVIARFFLNETKKIDRPEFVENAKRTLGAFKPLHIFLRHAG